MRTTYDLPVFQRSYDLYKEIYRAAKHFPKGDRYSLGAECKRWSLNIIGSVVAAARDRGEQRSASIDDALGATELLKVQIRLARETECLNEQQYLSLQQKLQEIGRMLGGWKRSL